MLSLPANPTPCISSSSAIEAGAEAPLYIAMLFLPKIINLSMMELKPTISSDPQTVLKFIEPAAPPANFSPIKLSE